ncbi:hypothetical protein NDU88_003019 [Pleurodeles waltl]|uniref:Uncharacterized protein n=1 Tax=Pleurodeles waltl TaxID=8319 RepID=A0AAV7MR36_PLEWA|nr:hypothetical protein NDU88_003019 [Pleurodeles waltl]
MHVIFNSAQLLRARDTKNVKSVPCISMVTSQHVAESHGVEVENDEADGDYFAGDDFEQDVKVCLIMSAVIQESEWKEELLKDDVLRKAIDKTMCGWGVKKSCEELLVPFLQEKQENPLHPLTDSEMVKKGFCVDSDSAKNLCSRSKRLIKKPTRVQDYL